MMLILFIAAIASTFGWNIDMFINYGRAYGYAVTLKKFIIVGAGMGMAVALFVWMVAK